MRSSSHNILRFRGRYTKLQVKHPGLNPVLLLTVPLYFCALHEPYYLGRLHLATEHSVIDKWSTTQLIVWEFWLRP